MTLLCFLHSMTTIFLRLARATLYLCLLLIDSIHQNYGLNIEHL